MRTAKKLQKIPFFTGIKENKPWIKIELLGTLFKFEVFSNDSVICREGDIGDKFFVIVDGKVSITCANEETKQEQELETLQAGQWFGEMSLLLNTPRSASAISKSEQTVVLSLTAQAFKKFLSIAPELTESFENMLKARTANTLKKFSFFGQVKENKPWSKLELLASLMTYEVYNEGEVVFRQKEKGDKFYILARGSVDVFVVEDGKEDAQLALGQYGLKIDHLDDGSYFGEIALVEETPRTATVVTVKPTVLLAITNVSFAKFLRIAPELEPIIAKTIVRRRRTLSTGVPEDALGLQPQN